MSEVGQRLIAGAKQARDELSPKRTPPMRDKLAGQYDGQTPTLRDEPSAFKRQCFRDGWDAAMKSLFGMVKPLVWVRPTDSLTDADWEDSTGIYQIEDSVLFVAHVTEGIICDDDVSAKAAAQADYETRIRSALTPPTERG